MNGIGDQCFARLGQRDQPGSKIHRFAENRVILLAAAGETGSDDLAAGNAEMCLERASEIAAQTSNRGVDLQCSPDRAQGIVAVRDRGTEQRHDGIADVLDDGATVAFDDAVDQRGIATYKIVQFLRVKCPGERGEPGEITEQDGDRPPVSERYEISAYIGFGGLTDRVIEIRDRNQQAFAMTQRSDAEIFEILGGQLFEKLGIDMIAGEGFRIFAES